MGKTLFLICVLALSGVSLAENPQTSWTTLSGLQTGQSIQIIEKSSKKHSGTFLSVSDTAISIQVAAGEQSIQRQDVRRVDLTKNKHKTRNTLIGVAVGGGAGAVIGAVVGAATHKGCSSQSFCFDIITAGELAGIGAAVGFVGGGIAGGVVGAFVPSHGTIYDVNAH
jgi:hypothetical protein